MMGPSALFFLLTIATASAAANDLPLPTPCIRPVGQCDCGKGVNRDLELTCPGNPPQNSSLEVKYLAEKYLKITCVPGTKSSENLDMLGGFVVGPVASVLVRMCNLESTFSDLVDKLSISDVQSFSVQYSNLTNCLDRSQFQSLTNISSLAVSSSVISFLPEDLFDDLLNLTRLELRDNEFELPVRIFHNLVNLTRLELGGNRIQNVAAGVFQNLTKLKLLNLWSNRMENISENAFKNLKSLVAIDLHNNNLTSLPIGVFDDLEKLQNLNLAQNKLTSLHEGLLLKTRQLKTFDLSQNPGVTLPPGLLSNLTNLTEVSICGSNLTSLPVNLLWGSSSVLKILLRGNKLTHLPEGFFKDAKSLETLDIAYNKLINLPSRIFSPLTKLRQLFLTNNQLSTITESALEGVTALEELYLDRNRLDSIDGQAFKDLQTLKIINLSTNYLSFPNKFGQSPLNYCTRLEKLLLANNSLDQMYYDWMTILTQLRTLDLRYNNITVIKDTELLFASQKLEIDLTHNKITDIQLEQLQMLVRASQDDPMPSGNLYSSPKHHVKVYLENNPLKCDCDVYELLRYREGRMLPEVRASVELITDSLRCSTPAEVSNVSISQLKSQMLQCRLNVTCPESCSCWARPFDRAFIVDCSNTGLLSAPESLWKPKYLNHTEIHLERNQISSLPNASQTGYDEVTKLYASHNKITKLECANLPPKLEVFEINNNNLTYVDASTLSKLWNETKLQRFSAFNNPWVCDCDARDLLSFLQSRFKQVEHLANMTCVDGRPIAELSADDLCPLPAMFIIATSLSIAVLGILIGTLAALYYRYQREVKVWLFAHNLFLWLVTEEELDKDKLYDAFVSYSHQDEDFVVNHLVPGLESGPTPFKLCLHFRDWVAGDWIPNQIARSVEDSRRTMVILSPNFMESVWGRMEFRAAHSQALSEGRARVIVVLYGDVGPLDGLDPELKAYLSMNTYVKWGDPWFWDKLRYALPHLPQKMKKAVMAATRPPDLRVKTTYDDKLELEPTTPSATTPPATILTNPLMEANGHIIPVLNGHAKLIAENGHLNGYVKSI